MIVLAAIFSWCWGIFLVVSFGTAFYRTLSSNRISLPTLVLSIYGLVFFFVGYALIKKKKLGGMLGIVLSLLLFLTILFFVQWKTLAIKFNYLVAALVVPVFSLIGWKKLK